jgi:hypothetical protein
MVDETCMSIAKRIKKAESDLVAQDHENALLQALIGVAGTSRKRYPSPQFGDREAFERFLRDDFNRKIQPNISIRGPFQVTYNGEPHTLEHVLYKFVRCELIHEAGLPPNIRFVPPAEGFHLRVQQDRLEMGFGVIEILVRLVKEAPENAGLFATA